MAGNNSNQQYALFKVAEDVGRAFSWISIGLAVLTALFQGLVTALASMTEASNRWTFRFRIALVEHWWWTFVSVLLLASLVMEVLSFVSGNGGAAVDVLALSSATFLAIVQYMVPAWQSRHYIKSRWAAWTGKSRSTIKADMAKYCGDANLWKRFVRQNAQQLSRLQSVPSDDYGWRLWRIEGIQYDPVDVLSAISRSKNAPPDLEKNMTPIGVYQHDTSHGGKGSLLWGQEQGFRRRMSRAVSSMPLSLLRSTPVTVEGYDGKGLTLALGILGRNKGIAPGTLVYCTNHPISTLLENESTWTPRPAKTIRSFYKRTIDSQFHFLGDQYVNAALELALLMADIPPYATDQWLSQSLEHQSLDTNHFLSDILQSYSHERDAALKANYESSYVSMIMSLNAMDLRMRQRHGSHHVRLSRPDLLCTGLLLRLREKEEPGWWNDRSVRDWRDEEIKRLPNELDWRPYMAKLLGFKEWPRGFEDSPSIWIDPDDESVP